MVVGLYALVAFAVILSFVRPYIGLLVLSCMPPFEESFLVVGVSGVTLTRYLGLLVAIAWIFGLLRDRRLPYVESSMKWGAMFLCWALLSLCWTAYLSDSVAYAFVLLRVAGLALMTADLASSPRRVAGVLGTFLAGCVGVSLLGMLYPSLRDSGVQLTLAGTGAKEFSMFAGGVVVAGCVLLSSGGTAAWMSRIAVPAGAVCLWVVFSAGERGTVVALVLTLLTLGLIQAGRARLVSWLAVAVVVVGVTSNSLLRRAGVVPEVASRYEVGELIASKGAGRVNIWKAGMALIARSPLLGHGLWTFGPLYAQNDMPSPRSGVVGGTYPHNDLLGVTVNLGIVGALLYLVLVGRAVARPLRVRSDAGSPQRRTLALLTAGLLVYWVAGGLTSDILHTKTFWLLLGLSYAAGRVPKAQYGGTWGQTDDGHLFRTAEETVESSRRRNRPVRPERGTDTE